MTPQVHRLLASHGAKATFFVVGERAKADPAAVQQLDRLVGSLKDAGYQFLTASELLATPDRTTA